MFDEQNYVSENGEEVGNTIVPVVTMDQTVEAWLSDLIHSIPALRETENYNKLRMAVDELKRKL